MKIKLKFSKKNNKLFLIQLYKKFFNINAKICCLYLIGSLFYYCSLTSIKLTTSFECFKKTNFNCFYSIAETVLISSIIIDISIFFILFLKLKKIHLFNIFLIYIYFFWIDHDFSLVKHGIYNFVGFILLVSLFLILFFYAKCILFFINKFKYKNIYFAILFFLSFSPIFFFFNIFKLNHFSCNNWAKGLNDTYIDNISKDYPCLINIPNNNSCYLSEIGKYFDFSSVFRPTCLDDKLLKSQREFFLKSLNNYDIKYFNISNKKYFGYPITNNEKFSFRDFGNTEISGKKDLEKELHKNIILMDLYIKNKTKYYPNEPEPEILVDFRKERGKIKIKIHKNTTLIKEKEKVGSRYNNKSMFKNVIVMFFDTISRAHFFRKFPKTIYFLNKFSKYETNFSKKKITVFQFFKYHSIGTYTIPNLKAAYCGAKVDGNGTYFTNYFKNQGYILGKATTSCEKSNLVFDKNKNINLLRWDHEGISIPCIKGIYQGFLLHKLSSLVKKCLFGKQIFEYALEYLESFLEVYFDYNKMFLFESIEGHEPTGQLVGYLDDIFYKFLLKLNSKNFFSNTTIILFSDHGNHINGIGYFFRFKDFFYERTLPFLFLIFTNNQELYEEGLYENIKSNQQIFITAFDIYYTLIHIAIGAPINEFSKNLTNYYGESLLKPINYSLRYCQSRMYDFQINSKICNCKIKK